MPKKTTPQNPFTPDRPARDKVITLRLTEAEHEAVRAAAKSKSQEMSDFIRAALGAAVENVPKRS